MPTARYKIGYFDEAYNAQFFILGGWVFPSQERADRCAIEFSAECARFPVNPDFHMQPARDALSTQWYWGPNCNLTTAEKFRLRDCRFEALLECLLRNRPAGFYVVLDRAAYEAIYRTKVPKSRDSEYFVLFYHLLFGIAKHYIEKGEVEPLQPVFDMQDQFSPMVSRWFDEAISSLAAHDPSAATILSLAPRFEHDSITPALKAADMLMWLVLRLQVNKISDETVGKLLDRIKGFGGKAGLIAADTLTTLRDLQRRDANALLPSEILAAI